MVVDKAGNGGDLEVSATFRPEYLAPGLNGLSVGEFINAGGIQRFLSHSTTGWVTVPRPWSIFVVARTPATAAGTQVRALTSGFVPGTGYFQFNIGATSVNGGGFQYRDNSGSTNSVTHPNFAAVGANTWYILSATCTGTTAACYVDDVFDVNFAGAEDLSGGFRLGHDADGGADNFGDWQGQIAECRIYNIDATAEGHRTTIYNELKTKWGL